MYAKMTLKIYFQIKHRVFSSKNVKRITFLF